jgi:hypothetical protein
VREGVVLTITRIYDTVAVEIANVPCLAVIGSGLIVTDCIAGFIFDVLMWQYWQYLCLYHGDVLQLYRDCHSRDALRIILDDPNTFHTV